MAGEIFIGYRREDSAGTTGRLYDRLTRSFAARKIFMDVDARMHGLDFAKVLDGKVAGCDVFLAVIGPRWLSSADKDGSRRLDNPDDFVRIELASALARDIPVIPVLVDGAAMPPAEALPDPLKGLARRHAVELRNARFNADSELVVAAVKARLGAGLDAPVGAWRRLGTIAAGAVALLTVGWVGLYFIGAPVWVPFAKGSATGSDPAGLTPGSSGAPTGAPPRVGSDPQGLTPVNAAAEAKAKADADRIAKAEERLQAAVAAQKQAEATARKLTDAAAAEAAARKKADDDAKAEQVRLAALKKQEDDRKRAEAQRDPLQALAPGSGQFARDRLATGQPCPMCPEMVVAPAGSFTMGSPASEPERQTGEVPLPVSIARPFAVARFAVTRGEFAAFVQDSGHKTDGGCYTWDGTSWSQRSDKSWRSAGFEQTDRHPVVCVNWDDAKAYTTWLSRKTGKSYRLLSEAEREYVTRAGTTTPFWWGASITPRQANYDGSYTYAGGAKGEYRQRTLPVDSFEANPWGLYNVHGNVWEWTEDCQNGSNQGNPGNGSPRTTGDCSHRVVRGGAWASDPRRLRAAVRFRVTTGDRFNTLSFRLGRTLTP